MYGVPHNTLDDYSQEAWARAWEFRKQFKGNCKFKTWVIRIGRNKFWMDLRSSEEHRTIHGLDIGSIDKRVGRNEAPAVLDYNDVVKELKANVENADFYLKYLQMHEVEGYTGRAIAKKMGLQYSNMKTKLFRTKPLVMHAVA